MESGLWSLLCLFLTGMTIAAYRHPSGYRHLSCVSKTMLGVTLLCATIWMKIDGVDRSYILLMMVGTWVVAMYLIFLQTLEDYGITADKTVAKKKPR